MNTTFWSRILGCGETGSMYIFELPGTLVHSLAASKLVLARTYGPVEAAHSTYTYLWAYYMHVPPTLNQRPQILCINLVLTCNKICVVLRAKIHRALQLLLSSRIIFNWPSKTKRAELKSWRILPQGYAIHVQLMVLFRE